MPKEVVSISIKGVVPTANGCALFLGNDDKTFVIHVEHSVGNALQLALNGVKKERPLTHDLISNILLGLGAKLEHVIINDSKDGTFFARILLHMENELEKKIIEIDARPSDSVVLAVQQQSPIYVNKAVFDAAEDMSEVLERVLKQQAEPTDENLSEDEEEGEGEDDDDLGDDGEDDLGDEEEGK